MRVLWRSERDVPEELRRPASSTGWNLVIEAEELSEEGEPIGGPLAWTRAFLAVVDDLTPEIVADLEAKGGAAHCIVLATEPSMEGAVWAMRRGAVDYIDAREPIGQVLSASITQQLERLRRVSSSIIDPLTGLPSHSEFQSAAAREISLARRHGHDLGLIVIDIDDFESINEKHGHAVGDQVLTELGGLIGGAYSELPFRAGDLIARLSGDRFVVLLPNTDKRGAAVRAARLRVSCERRAFGALPAGEVTLSAGVSAISDKQKDRKSLQVAAERALDMAKRRGRNRVVTYNPALDSEDVDVGKAFVVEVELLQALEESIDKVMLNAAFQPIVRSDTLEIYGYECLCRPTHAGFPGPWQLFSTAERAGRVAELGYAVRTVAQSAFEELPEGRSVFINLHPLELNGKLLSEAEGRLRPFAEKMVLEITETAQLNIDQFHIDLFKRLRELGFRIALDDLGSGYAGLNSLSALSPDIVKLDMALIRGIHDPATARLLRHIIEFADGEDMLVVAEGIETAEEGKAALEIGCHLFQGYYFAKPGPAFPELLVDKLE